MVSQVETNPSCFTDFPALYALLVDSYAFMEHRINPPSSLAEMNVAAVKAKAAVEDLLLIRDGTRPVACLFCKGDGPIYEVGKVAVANTHRKQGLARAMIDAAADLGRMRGHKTLQLFARVELVENHETYRRLGFAVVDNFTHPGFVRPTALIFQRPL